MASLLPSNQEELAENSEINVTPFIDVMLVLLIIFMVVAPLSTVSVDVNLPTSNAEAETVESEPFVVSLDENLSIAVLGETVSEANLAKELAKGSDGDVTKTLYLQADKKVGYGELMVFLNTLRSLGYSNVALVGLDQLEQ